MFSMKALALFAWLAATPMCQALAGFQYASLSRTQQISRPRHRSVHAAEISGTNENSDLGVTRKEAQRFLAGSRLVYLYAELRQLSYCGYTKTIFSSIENNVTQFKLVNTVLNELEHLVLKRMTPGSFFPEEVHQRKDEWLLEALRTVLNYNFDAIEIERFGERSKEDLEVLEANIQRIRDNEMLPTGLQWEESMQKKRSLASKLAEIIELCAQVTKAFLGIRESEDFPDAGDRKLLEVLHSFSEDCLKQNSFREALKEEIELIGFGDRYPGKECVYAITTNKSLNRTTVVFRGSVNLNDWANNLLFSLTEVENPGSDDTKMGIHRGFHAFLLRQREDEGGETKLEEILREALNSCDDQKDWTLSVTGHSLGGALATLFGFFAATRDDVKIPVEVFTFASPFVGDSRFCEACNDLTEKGALLHRRVENVDDIVPLLPVFAPDRDSWKGFIASMTCLLVRLAYPQPLGSSALPLSFLFLAITCHLLWKSSCYKHVGQRIQLRPPFQAGELLPPVPFARALDNHDLARYGDLLRDENAVQLDETTELKVLWAYVSSNLFQISFRSAIVGTAAFFFISFDEDLLRAFGWFTDPISWVKGQAVLFLATILFILWARLSYIFCDPTGFLERARQSRDF